MVQIQQMVLYQPDQVIASRVPGGAKALAVYLKSLEEALERHYRAAPIPPAGRALVAAVGPGDRFGYWLIAPDEREAPEWSALEPVLKDVPRPSVQNGPVAIALLCNLGEDFRPPKPPAPVPAAWVAAVRAAGKNSLDVDSILTELMK